MKISKYHAVCHQCGKRYAMSEIERKWTAEDDRNYLCKSCEKIDDAPECTECGKELKEDSAVELKEHDSGETIIHKFCSHQCAQDHVNRWTNEE